MNQPQHIRVVEILAMTALNVPTNVLMSKFLALLQGCPEALTDAEVRGYFQKEGHGEYEKLPEIINILMSQVCSTAI
jgi:hypothetical protein